MRRLIGRKDVDGRVKPGQGVKGTLQRLSSREAGAVAEGAHRVAHQEALQGRQAVDHGEPGAPPLRESVLQATGHDPPQKAWILQEGAEPSWSSPGAVVALLAMLLAAVQIVTLVTPSRRRAAR